MRPIIAVDSDGCALDAMESKHRHGFAPATIEVWRLQSKSEEVLRLSLEINLYSRGRGLNRFLALHHLFVFLWAETPLRPQLPNPSVFQRWFDRGGALSEEGLRGYMSTAPIEDHGVLQRLLTWTTEVNRRIEALGPPEPFESVLETLQEAASQARIHVVSSATEAALRREWEEAGLHSFVEGFHGQECGSKASILRGLLLECGSNEQLLMIGDAWGDYEASQEAGVRFFPIEPGRESASWNRLGEQVLPAFFSGSLDSAELKRLVARFRDFLKPIERVSF